MTSHVSKDSVLILAAGKCLRMAPHFLPKHLLPYRGKAILSHILGAYPSSSNFLIVVSADDSVTAPFLKLVHPNLNVLVVVSENEHRGNPLYDLQFIVRRTLKSKSVFVTVADGVYALPDFTDIKNWVGMAKVMPDLHGDYTNSSMAKALPSATGPFTEKWAQGPGHIWSWTGVAHFSSALNLNSALASTLLANPNATFSDLFNCIRRNTNLFALLMPRWSDLGTQAKYEEHTKDEARWTRPDQVTFQYPTSVVKAFQYLIDAVDFVRRNKDLPLPLRRPALNKQGSLVACARLPGVTGYQGMTAPLLVGFLDLLLNNFWPVPDTYATPEIKRSLKRGVIEKTKDRLYSIEALSNFTGYTINGVPIVESWDGLLSDLESTFFDVHPGQVHGDLTLDNLIVNGHGVVSMIDWRPVPVRENYSTDEPEVGDVYYDLAKLWLSCEFHFERMKTREFSVLEQGFSIEVNLPVNTGLLFLQRVLEEWIEDNGFDLNTVKMNAAMQVVSMAGLHPEPYSNTLFLYSLYLLNKQA